MGGIRTKWIALAAAALTGCGNAGRRADANDGRVEIRDSAGVRTVINHVTGDDQPLTVDEVLRVGIVDGDEHYLFSHIGAIAVGGEGRLYVADDRSGTIRVFSPGGQFIRDFGRRGNGPGEFRQFVSADVVGDTVAVFGVGQGIKAVLFSRGGRLLGEWNLERRDGLEFQPIAFVRGGWIGSLSDQNLWPRRFPPDTAVPLRLDLVRQDPWEEPAGPPFLRLTFLVFHTNQKGELQRDLFGAVAWLDVDRNGVIYSVVAGEYRIDVFSDDGRQTMSVSRDHESVPLGDGDVEAILAKNDAYWDTASVLLGLDRATRRRLGAESIREQARWMPSHLAPLRRLIAPAEGGFWVERIDHRPASDLGRGMIADYYFDYSTRWDVFGPDGAFRYAVDLPPHFSPFVVTDSSATGVQTDEMDVEYVVTYQVRKRDVK